MNRYYVLCLLGISLVLAGCSNLDEQRAKELYDIANRYSELRDYDKAVEILQKIRINYENTEYASLAETEITNYEELQKLLIQNQVRKMNTSFLSIRRALETYKVRFLAYPLAASDLDKIPTAVVPDWNDAWNNRIHYKPTYSSPNVPRRSPDGYVLATFGKDGLPGGTNEDKDLFFKDGKQVGQILTP